MMPGHETYFHFISCSRSHVICILLLLTGCLMNTAVQAENYPEQLFHTGEKLYSEGHYEEAIQAFSSAIEIEPQNAVYYHRLGKSYGRLAEKSSLLKAFSLSGKTRDALEQAVTLDNTNIEALSDLLEYYEQAPVFLGGGKDKADTIRQRLRELGHVANDT